jgi:type IV pilus assembly protein PilX
MSDPLTHAPASAARQRGAVLFVALVFLLVLTLIAVMLARSQTTEVRLAQNDANHDLAIEAAGATLRFAEMNIAEGTYSDFSQNTAGLYTLDPASGSVYSSINWSSSSEVLSYGGPTLTEVSATPKFIIEQMPAVALPGTSLGACQQGYGANGCVQVFQITAQAAGGDQSATATLRSIYERQ